MGVRKAKKTREAYITAPFPAHETLVISGRLLTLGTASSRCPAWRLPLRVLITCAAALLANPGIACADDVANATYLCAIINATGLTNTQCEMSAATLSVTSTMEISVPEANKLCGKLVDLMARGGRPFSTRWVLNFRSPYSDKNRIAFCVLPTRAAPQRRSNSHSDGDGGHAALPQSDLE